MLDCRRMCVVLVACGSIMGRLQCAVVNSNQANNDGTTLDEVYDGYCYDCSSDSVLCGETVYDGHILSTTTCKSSCFLRTENNVTYRGCFDGWMGGMVRHNYVGCRKQVYLGKAVEWCFCSTDPTEAEPCNGQSRGGMAQTQGNYIPPRQTGHSGGESSMDSSAVAKSGYDTYQEEYPYINQMADLYQDIRGEIFSCKDKRDGTYSDPGDCNRYYLCSNGYSYRMRCSRGTQWNQALRACAFAFHVAYPCKQTAHGRDVTSYPYMPDQQPNFVEVKPLKTEKVKPPKQMEEFYHYY